MKNKTCGECKYFEVDVVSATCEKKLWICDDETPACRKFEPQNPTVFDRITASPEVLAKELVNLDCDSLWFAWVGIGRREAFSTREEAIAATVAKLKEVCDE